MLPKKADLSLGVANPIQRDDIAFYVLFQDHAQILRVLVVFFQVFHGIQTVGKARAHAMIRLEHKREADLFGERLRFFQRAG